MLYYIKSIFSKVIVSFIEHRTPNYMFSVLKCISMYNEKSVSNLFIIFYLLNEKLGNLIKYKCKWR